MNTTVFLAVALNRLHKTFAELGLLDQSEMGNQERKSKIKITKPLLVDVLLFFPSSSFQFPFFLQLEPAVLLLVFVELHEFENHFGAQLYTCLDKCKRFQRHL